MSPLEITLVILLVTIIAFVSGKVPFSVISTGIILALILTGIKTPAEAFGGFINTNVVMFVAMFVIGAGLTKTPLIDKAQSLVIRYKDNMRMLIFLSCVAGAFLGAITSATATAAIMIPLLVGIANDIGVSRSKLLYPSMACANIATQMTFLGQGASNMAWNDVMMQAGAPTPLHIWDFTIARIPMLTIAILYMTFVGYKLMPDIPNEQFSDAAHTASEGEKLSPFKRKLAVLIVLVSIAMIDANVFCDFVQKGTECPLKSTTGIQPAHRFQKGFLCCILRLLLVRCMPTAIVQNLWIVRCNQSVQRTRISALHFPQQ